MLFNEQFGFLHANKDIVGKEMIMKAFAPNFWRAKNYNDRLGWRPTVHNGFWKDADKKLEDNTSIKVSTSLSMSAWNMIQEELNNAKHIGEPKLLPDSFTLNIDLIQYGVGGTDTWSKFAAPYAPYRISKKEYNYSFTLCPVVK